MSDIVSLFEKRVDRMMNKMFGEGNNELKTITKLAIMNDKNTPEIQSILEQMRERVKEEQAMLLEEMTMTLDASGNVVPLVVDKKEELSPRQEDIKVIYHDN